MVVSQNRGPKYIDPNIYIYIMLIIGTPQKIPLDPCFGVRTSVLSASCLSNIVQGSFGTARAARHTHTDTHTHTHTDTHTHTPDTRSKPVVRRSLFFGLLYLLGIFKVPQNAIRVDIRIDIRVIFSEYSLKPKRLTMNCIDSGRVFMESQGSALRGSNRCGGHLPKTQFSLHLLK